MSDVPYNNPLIGRTFGSLSLAREELDNVCDEAGFRLRVWKSSPSRNRACYVVFQCRKAGPSKMRAADEPVLRVKSTASSGCPYRIALKLGPQGWTFQAMRVARRGCHNHSFVEMGTFSATRQKLLEPRREEIYSLNTSGLSPKRILAHLRRLYTDLSCVTLRDIHNILGRERRMQRGNMDAMGWLREQLEDTARFWHRIQTVDVVADDGQVMQRLTALFVAPMTSVALLREHPDILFMDCTYQTNKYLLPLFNICGITNDHRTMQVAVCFLPGEKKTHYTWAVASLGEFLLENTIPLPQAILTDRELALIRSLEASPIFDNVPHLLCRWHVNRNVATKVRQWFPKATKSAGGAAVNHPEYRRFLRVYREVMKSETEELFRERYSFFRGAAGFPSKAVKYVADTWIEPWNERLVACFINRHTHFGHVTTSVVESSHHSIKTHLSSPTGDLSSVFKDLTSYWSEQVASIRQERRTRRDTVPVSAGDRLFDEIRHLVVHKALKLLVKEKQKLVFDEVSESWRAGEDCRPCPLLHTHGLPCCHIISTHLNTQTTLRPSQLHAHWYWERRAEGEAGDENDEGGQDEERGDEEDGAGGEEDDGGDEEDEEYEGGDDEEEDEEEEGGEDDDEEDIW